MRASCQFPCGAESAQIRWKKDTGEENNIAFRVGHGSNVEYELADSQCLSSCHVVDYSAVPFWGGHRSCGQSVKVSKASKDDEGSGGEEFKLCCTPKPCTYVPENITWKMHVAKEDKTFQPLKPMNDLQSTEPHSCLCCNRHQDYIAWGYPVRDHCKLGYTPSSAASLGRSSLRHFSVLFSASVLSQQCEWYCSHYPDFRFSLYSSRREALVGIPGENDLEETGLHGELSYKDHCLDDFVSIVAEAGHLTPTAEVPRHEFEQYKGNWTGPSPP